MVNKFKTATKRIAAVAASAAIVSSTAFAGGLSNYPNNFVQNGKFVGQIVVGATADAMDSASAISIINDLKSEFSGTTDKVKITATKSTGASGQVISVVKSNQALDYGDKLGQVTEQAGFDDGDAAVLSDETFDNRVSNEDYEQKLFVGRDINGNNYGEFNYALRDNVDGVDKIANGVYFANGDIYAQYVFDLKKAIKVDSDSSGSLSTSEKDNFVGKTLRIMGVDYTISDIGVTAGQGVTKLDLIGGANKISLDEGSSTTVNVDGTDYDVKVSQVTDDKVLITVNGQTETIDKFDTDTVGGVSVAVTDLLPSTRDSVPGNAEIVIGGQKISLENGNVKINDEDVNDLYDDYNVDVTFTAPADDIDKFVVTYKVDDDVLLEKGDSLIDPLFGAFTVKYDGTNDVTYTDLTVKTDDDDLRVEGTLDNGNTFNQPLLHAIKKSNDQAGAVYMVGDNDDDRIIFNDSDTSIGKATGESQNSGDLSLVANVGGDITQTIELVQNDSLNAVATVTESSANSITVQFDGDGSNNSTWNNVTSAINGDATFEGSVTTSHGTDILNASDAQTITSSGGIGGLGYDTVNNYWVLDPSQTSLKGDGFLVRDTNKEDQYLYEVKSISTKTGDHTDEVSFDELLQDKDKEDVVFSATDFASAFEVTLDHIGEGTPDKIYISDGAKTSQLSDIIAFKDQVLLTLGSSTEQSDLEDNGVASSGSKGSFKIDFDNADLDFEDETSVHPFTISYDWDTSDTEFNLYLNDDDFVNANHADDVKSNSDDQTFVNAYGVKVAYDNNDKKELTVSMPDKEVQGKVSLIFGDAGNVDTKTYTVDADKADAKVKELEDEGYSVTTEKIPAQAVEFDISSPVFDTDVTDLKDSIVVGGPAVNSAARELLGITTYTVDQAGVAPGQGIAKYFADKNNLLVYGYSKEDTAAIAKQLNAGTANIQ